VSSSVSLHVEPNFRPVKFRDFPVRWSGTLLDDVVAGFLARGEPKIFSGTAGGVMLLIEAEPGDLCWSEFIWFRRSAVRLVFFMIAYRMNGMKKIRIAYTPQNNIQSSIKNPAPAPKASIIAKCRESNESPKIFMGKTLSSSNDSVKSTSEQSTKRGLVRMPLVTKYLHWPL
jgi:hypothetical protein